MILSERAGEGDVFMVPLKEKYLVYAPLHHVTAVVNPAATAQVKNFIEHPQTASIAPNLRSLADRLLASSEISSHNPAPTPPQRPEGPFSPERLAILMNNDCNLRCLYCAPEAGEGMPLVLSPEICDAGLRFYADIVKRDRLPQFTLYLHGGEPFLHREILSFCMERAAYYAGQLNIPVYAAATTNGVMSEERASWAADHFQFIIVSLDGPPGLQNRQRPRKCDSDSRSFEAVCRTLSIFRRRRLRFGIRCTVAEGNTEQMADIADYFCRTFHPSVINFEPVTVWGRCRASGLQPPPPHAYVRGMMAAASVLKRHGVELKTARSDVRQLIRSNCGLADDQLVLTPDGFASACFGAESGNSPYRDTMMMGKYDAEAGRIHLDSQKVAQIRGLGVEDIGECRDCFCKWHCAGGCRIIHTPVGKAPSETACEMTRLLTLWQLLASAGLEKEIYELL